MTEDEAKMKTCCGPEGTGYANDQPLPARYCIASACMAWRKTGSKFKDARTGHLGDRDLTGHGAWIDTGFCGLAGSPS